MTSRQVKISATIMLLSIGLLFGLVIFKSCSKVIPRRENKIPTMALDKIEYYESLVSIPCSK